MDDPAYQNIKIEVIGATLEIRNINNSYVRANAEPLEVSDIGVDYSFETAFKKKKFNLERPSFSINAATILY